MRRKTDKTIALQCNTHATAKDNAKARGMKLTNYVDRILVIGMEFAKTPRGKKAFEGVKI